MAVDADVVVIGAGLSGLCCARELLRHDPGLRVTVCEADDRVGGRTLVDADGTDLGGAYVGPGQDRVLRLVDEYGLRLRTVPSDGDTVLCISGAAKRYRGLVPPVSLLGALELNAALVAMDRIEAAITDPLRPEEAPDAAGLDGVTLQAFIAEHCPYSAAARAMLETAVQCVLAVPPSAVSVLGWCWYCRCSGGVKRVLETRGGLQDSKVVGGAGQLARRVAEDITGLGAALRLSSPVTKVAAQGSSVSVAGEGWSLSASHVVVALPPMQQLRIGWATEAGGPLLPYLQLQALQRWPMGGVAKVFAYYDRPYWREAGLNGTVVSPPGAPVLMSLDDSDPARGQGCLMGFVLGDALKRFAAMSTSARAAFVGAHFAATLKDPRLATPVAFKAVVWPEQPWAGGCYTGVPVPGALTSHPRHAMAAPAAGGRVLFAGTENAALSPGYMDGAVEAGERVARDLLVARGTLPASQQGIVSRPPPSRQMRAVPVTITAGERLLPSSTAVVRCVAAAAAAGAAYGCLCYARRLDSSWLSIMLLP